MPKQQKILVVEDNVTTRLYIKRILRKLGYGQVLAVDDGETALLELKVSKFDLIISDWDMPKLDGIEFLKALQKSPKLKTIPFLMVTAEKEVFKIEKALRLGVDSYLVKPFEPGHLKSKLKELLREPDEEPEEVIVED